jgi:hypothetical protein
MNKEKEVRRIHETGFTTLYDPADAAHGLVAE